MSFGAGYGGRPEPSSGMLASESDREATQAVLKQAFEDERLTQDEFEARVGKAVAARTYGDLAALTRDLPAAPVPPPRRSRPAWTRLWPVGAGIAAVVAIVGLVVGLTQTKSSSPARTDTSVQAPANPNPHPPAGPGGAGDCPVGTSGTALTIANALATDPVYVDPGSSLLTTAQSAQLRTAIGRVDAGRIRIAAVKPATVTKGGGLRTLANAVASCQADATGTTIVTTPQTTYVVTSYNDYRAASSAVGAALNTHTSLGAGLIDAVRRVAIVDKSGN